MSAAGPRPCVVIHTNDRQLIAALVSAHSLKSRSRHPDRFDVRILRQEETPQLCKYHRRNFIWWEGDAPSVWRKRDLQAFAPLRRMVPAMLGFRGRALVLDPDVFAVGDVYDLLSRDMKGKAILCREKPERHNGQRQFASAVMLLDCEKLTHWQWERDIDEIFALRKGLAWWISLMDEQPERIGLFEDEWNDFDTLTDKTQLLHNTRILTQPWKTGLPADFHEHAPLDPLSWERLAQAVRRGFGRDRKPRLFFRPHPDPRQERLFFTLLKECLERGSITTAMLRAAIRRKYLRRDAFALMGMR